MMKLRALLILLVAAICILADPAGDEGVARQVPGRRFRIKPLTHSEQYYERMQGLRPDKPLRRLDVNAYYYIKDTYSNVALPASFNWADISGVVTPSKYQGGCGGCYAFAATAAMESMMAIWGGTSNLDLSEQQLVDCSKSHGNGGCGDGTLVNAYRYLKDNGGQKLESAYPYKEADGECNKTATELYGGGIVFGQMPYGDEEALKRILYTVGPISIGINAREKTIYQYVDGIYDNPECSLSSKAITHGVLLVGYGEENGTPYWVIKNSWGSTWGQNGFMKLLRGQNMCYIGKMGSFPIFEWLAKLVSTGEDVRHPHRLD